MEKKREILPILEDAIMSLVELYDDSKTLEVSDNEQASKRLRKNIIAFKNTDLKNLEIVIGNIRFEINVAKGRVIKRDKKELKEKKEFKYRTVKPINQNNK